MANLIIEAVLIGLASWRLANMLVNEDGPGLVFEKLRVGLGVGKPGIVSGFFPTLFSCIFCISVYTTIAAYLVWQISPEIVMLVAAMTVALIANKFAGAD